jgi:BirA family transcriptional regulator, biotin operon repressor / biotin---[acetyl-CoA-carboxylase] ligase
VSAPAQAPAAAPAALDAETIRAGLATRWLAREVVCLERTDSTMRVVAERALAGAPHGLAVVAEEQTAGRGRLGRSFHSPPRANLYTSILLRPTPPGMLAPTLVLASGVAVADCVAAWLGDPSRVDLKWPNDVRIDRRKTSGILVELSSGAAGPAFAVLGIGVNLNVDPATFPDDFRRRATSLAAAGGRAVDRPAFARALYGSLETVLDLHASSGFPALRPRFDAWFRMRGQRVRVREPGDRVLVGVAIGVDADGALRLADGAAERRVLAGEVSLLPEEDA